MMGAVEQELVALRLCGIRIVPIRYMTGVRGWDIHSRTGTTTVLRGRPGGWFIAGVGNLSDAAAADLIRECCRGSG